MSRRTKVAGCTAVAAALLAAPLALAAPASAAPKPPIVDFNGDGYADLAIQAPFGSLQGVAHAGYVSIVYGSPTGMDLEHPENISQDLTWVPGEASETYFGSSTAARDLDGDGYTDLVVSAGNNNSAIVWGTSGGLHEATALSGHLSGLVDGDFNGDGEGDFAARTNGTVKVFLGPFTRAGAPASTTTLPEDRDDVYDLVAGDMNGDGKDDLVTTHGHEERAYKARWWKGTSTGLSKTYKTTGHYTDGGVIADVNMDGYGDYVASDVGSVSEMSMYEAGTVRVVYGGASGPTTRTATITQDTKGVPGVGEAGWRGGDDSDYGDQFGYSLAAGDVTGDGYPDIAVGVPGEDIGSVRDAGSVVLLKGGRAGLTGTGAQAVDQSDAGVPGASEAGDQFGREVSLLDVNSNNRADLAVSAPTEDGTYKDSGAVWVFRGSKAGLTTTSITSFGPKTVWGPEKEAMFGSGFAK
ncbi:FG-GAP-like repeat-containing protein [Streptomyces graminofaciens]|nr:FG-GAP-like repeat-containing protein [Streptomyces graminofaciens]